MLIAGHENSLQKLVSKVINESSKKGLNNKTETIVISKRADVPKTTKTYIYIYIYK